MNVDLSKTARSLDGSPLFEHKESVGLALAGYLMDISTHNPLEMAELAGKMSAGKPFDVSPDQRGMLEEVVIKSNLKNILKIQLLGALDVVEEEAIEVPAVDYVEVEDAGTSEQ